MRLESLLETVAAETPLTVVDVSNPETARVMADSQKGVTAGSYLADHGYEARGLVVAKVAFGGSCLTVDVEASGGPDRGPADPSDAAGRWNGDGDSPRRCSYADALGETVFEGHAEKQPDGTWVAWYRCPKDEHAVCRSADFATADKAVEWCSTWAPATTHRDRYAMSAADEAMLRVLLRKADYDRFDSVMEADRNGAGSGYVCQDWEVENILDAYDRLRSCDDEYASMDEDMRDAISSVIGEAGTEG